MLYEQYLAISSDMCDYLNLVQARLCVGKALGRLGRYEEGLLHQQKALALARKTCKESKTSFHPPRAYGVCVFCSCILRAAIMTLSCGGIRHMLHDHAAWSSSDG